MVFDLNPPKGNIPPATAPQADRVSALMTWIDSTIGPGLEALQTSLENVLNNHGLLPNQPPSQRTDRNEKTLLSAVWAEVQDRLKQSLHNAVLLNLGKAEQRHQVSRPWDSQLRIADQASRPLDPETAIVEVFDQDDINGRLLILGNPGAGKTTTMLDLAAALVQRANTDPTQPIPVMFNLSSWQDDKQTLKDWLLSELKLKYGVSPKLGQPWLEAQTLLPLLDGLDELPPHRQEPAVQKISDWLQSGEGASQLLVCSRREEYELYATKLLLNGAICLEPLTDSQLATYFAALGMEPLWHTVRQDPDFLALVRTPLLLSVSILANDAIDPGQWQRLTTPQERLDYLLDAYIQRQLHAPIASRTYPPHKQPTPQQTRHWLTWLAQQLQAQSEDEFLIEKMQPYMLRNHKQKRIYWLIAGLFFGSLIGLSLLLTDLAVSEESSFIHGLIQMIAIGLIFGILGGLFCGFSEIDQSIDRFEDFLLSPEAWKSLLRSLKVYLIIGIILGCLLGLSGWNQFRTYTWIIFGITIGILFGLSFGLIDGINFFNADISSRLKPNQGIWKTAQNILPLTLTFYPVTFLLILAIDISLVAYSNPDSLSFDKPISFNWPQALIGGIPLAFLLGGMKSGWLTCLQHFILRIMLHRTSAIPWNYARFLNHCTERLLLQRVGGRYRFIHRLIQERFAATGGHRLPPP